MNDRRSRGKWLRRPPTAVRAAGPGADNQRHLATAVL